MLDAGIWLPPSQFEAAFLGIAHDVSEIAATMDAATTAFAEVSASSHS
jgi:glutamate-1-semialdehyde 2,1-aminomutase